MLICFFDQEGIAHQEFVPPAMTVNADFYRDVLRRLRENVRCKRPQKWRNQNLIIQHDNALAHRSFKVSQFLAKNSMTVIPHTHSIWPPVTFPSSPSWSFGWRVEHSSPLKRFKRNRSGYLTLPKMDFQGCFQAWQKRWDRCIHAQGEYFEDDGGI